MGSAPPVEIGDVLLGKYRVERVLGQGGMGIVVAVRHLDLDELFAVKVMLPMISDSGEAVERFLREARAAAKLKGEHVAKVHDVGRLPNGALYMLLEYLVGTDLQALVRRDGPLPVSDAVEYVMQACETLREAHDVGIVHRDIKPANIFLTHRPNGSPCIKVIDFGISKFSAPDAVALTATSSVGGSPVYMSPEQMRSAKHLDHRTDIWSMGIVLYELLVGTTPFHADTITAVAGRVLQDEPKPPSLHRPDIPPALDATILRCLAKRSYSRYSSMSELMSALRAVAHAHHMRPPDSSPERSAPTAENAPRGHLPSSAQVLGATTLSGQLPTVPIQQSREFPAQIVGSTTGGLHRSSPPLQSPSRGLPPALVAAFGVLFAAVFVAGAWALHSLSRGNIPPPHGASGNTLATAPTSSMAMGGNPAPRSTPVATSGPVSVPTASSSSDAEASPAPASSVSASPSQSVLAPRTVATTTAASGLRPPKKLGPASGTARHEPLD